MVENYRKHIVSNKDFQVWLHRTHSSNLEGILKHGLAIGGDLSSTATLQSEDINSAEGNYRLKHKGSNVVVVIKIPKAIADRHFDAGENGSGAEGYLGDKDVTYYSPERKNIFVQRQHVHGWIDNADDKYHENHHLKDEQKLGEEHFPRELYGGLEMKSEIRYAEDEKPKRRRIPKNIKIVD